MEGGRERMGGEGTEGDYVSSVVPFEHLQLWAHTASI